MAGKKGRSGRKSIRDEEKRLKVIEKAWELVSQKLNSNDIARFSVAKDIVLKDQTTKIEGKGFDANQHIQLIQQLPEGDLRSLIKSLRTRTGEERSSMDN